MPWHCSVVVCFLLCATHYVAAFGEYSRTVSYNDQVVVRCTDKRKATIQLLQRNSDVWNVGEQSIDLRLAQSTFAAVQKYVPECHVLIQDVESHVQMAEVQMFPAKLQEEEAWSQEVLHNILKTKPSLADCEAAIQNWEKARLQDSDEWFSKYHNYEDIVKWYKNQAEKYPRLAHFVESIGQSTEGRNMPALHITASTDPNHYKIYFQCLIHAREWIAGAVCMYIVDYLLSHYEQDEKVNFLINNLEFIIVPFVNPDGYVYSWTQDRLWRKNRRVVDSQLPYQGCQGVDINRNFPNGWMEAEAGQECQEDYGGPEPVSEKETQNIINYWRANGPIIGAIDWHSYGKLVLHPWGFSHENTENNEVLSRIGQKMTQIIKTIHQKDYTSEKSIDLYQCYGIATDWFYSDDASLGNGGFRAVSYVIELRGEKMGFLLPPKEIKPTAEEIVPAVIYFAEAVLASPIPFKQGAAQNIYSPEHSS